MTGRRNLGFGDDQVVQLPTAKRSPDELELRRKAAEVSSQEMGFPSREGGAVASHAPTPRPAVVSEPSAVPPQTKPDRRKRTFRTAALTARVTQEHYDKFYAVVDGHESRPGVGQVMEKAIEALISAIERGEIKF